MMLRLLVFCVGVVLLAGCQNQKLSQASPAAVKPKPSVRAQEFQGTAYHVSDLAVIGKASQWAKPGKSSKIAVMRRDPSDIIKVGDWYYLFYTQIKWHVDAGKMAPIWPEGYYGVIAYARSKDGIAWQECGKVLGKGAPRRWDSFGVFTPNVLQGKDGKFYLYFTGVQDGFVNNATTDFTGIGVAGFSFGEDGLVNRCQRLNQGQPIIKASAGRRYADGKPWFDSYRVDDAALVVRDGKYYLYYKGRAQNGGPGGTKMGLAISDRPDGGFERVHTDGKPVQGEGHEVMVYAYRGGVVSVVSNVGRGIYFAEDGVNFKKIAKNFKGYIHAPGAYRPELTDHNYDQGISWGISMMHRGHRYLTRWEKQ